MRIIHDFEYKRPSSLPEAFALLDKYGDKARPLAGGTDVIVNMKCRSMLQLVDGAGTDKAVFPSAKRVPPIDRPEILVSLADLSMLRGIRIDVNSVNIGPATTMTKIVQAAGLPPAVEALRDAAGIMGSPLIRNKGTVGGNLVNARPAADTAVALGALNTTVELASSSGTRAVKVSEFITAPGKTVRKPNELVVLIEIPVGKGQGSAYFRQGTRRQLEIALVGVASWLQLSDDGKTILDAKICLGAVGPTPLLASEASTSLIGNAPAPAMFKEAASKARSEARPIDDFRGSAAYRLDLVETLVFRSLVTAVQRAMGWRKHR